MIEDGLFLALGFCVATLIAIGCLPVVWRRALRQTRARLSRMMPSSQAEVDAVHDGLRAQAAVAQRRLEQRLEWDQEVAGALKADLGRRTASLVVAERAGEALRTERGALLGEIDALAREGRDGEGQRVALEKALHDADTQAETALAAAMASVSRLREVTARVEEQRDAIAALEARAAGLRAEVEEGRDRVAALEAVAAQHAKAELALEAAFELKRSEAERLKAGLAATQATLDDERRHAVAQARMVQEGRVATEARVVEQDGLTAERQTELTAITQRIEALEAALKARFERPAGDVEAADHADALLRGAIVAIGDDALRLLGPSKGGQVSERDGTERIGAGQP